MVWLLAAAIVAGIVAGAYIRRHQYRPRSFATYFTGFKPQVASHRGYGKHGPIAENTVPAFLASEDLGFRAHELDVRRTRESRGAPRLRRGNRAAVRRTPMPRMNSSNPNPPQITIVVTT